jgi:hypothetical protein
MAKALAAKQAITDLGNMAGSSRRTHLQVNWAVSEGKQLGRPRIAADMERRISAALKAREETGESNREVARIAPARSRAPR